jgi:hypothetical protein
MHMPKKAVAVRRRRSVGATTKTYTPAIELWSPIDPHVEALADGRDIRSGSGGAPRDEFLPGRGGFGNDVLARDLAKWNHLARKITRQVNML